MVIIGKQLKQNVMIPSLHDPNNNRCATTDESKCEVLSKYFSSVFNTDNATIPENLAIRLHFDNLINPDTTEMNVSDREVICCN